MSLKIGLVGASGAVGQEILAALAEAASEERLELDPPVLLATGRLEGESFAWLEGEDDTLPLERFDAEAIRGLDGALVAVPEAAAGEVVAALRRQGTLVVDTSRKHRETAPLYLAPGRPGLTGQSLVALPSPEALLTGRIVAALTSLRPTAVRATVLRPSSALGQVGVSELAEGTARLLNGVEPESGAVPHRLAFNLVPQVGAFDGPDAESERDLVRELPRLTGLASLRVSATVALAPWFYGTTAFLNIACAQPSDLEQARSLLRAAEGLKLLDDAAGGIYPMPALATGDESGLVGRLRVDPVDGGLQLVAVIDGVRATAVQAVAALETLLRQRVAH